MTTTVTASCGAACIADRAIAYGFPGVTVDGNDTLALYDATQDAVARARRGEGPTLLEAVTYRWTPHTANEPERRPQEEIDAWKAKDPIKRLEEVLASHKVPIAEISPRVYDQVQREIADAIRCAEEAPLPSPEDVWHGLYYGEREVM